MVDLPRRDIMNCLSQLHSQVVAQEAALYALRLPGYSCAPIHLQAVRSPAARTGSSGHVDSITARLEYGRSIAGCTNVTRATNRAGRKRLCSCPAVGLS